MSRLTKARSRYHQQYVKAHGKPPAPRGVGKPKREWTPGPVPARIFTLHP